MKKQLLRLLLIITFIKGILWAGITPIFQAPDEPLHYAHVQYIAEKNDFNFLNDTASREIEKSLKYLEFEKIVFKPNKKQTFTNSFFGPNEKYLTSVKKQEKKKESLKLKLTSENPPLYYLFGGFFYRFSLSKTLIWQVYFVRIYSILTLAVTVFFCFKTAELIYDKKRSLFLVVPTILSFFPMLNFIAGAVNNDNLFILLNTLIIYLIVKDAKKNLDLKEIAFFGIIAGAAALTRQNFLPLFFYLIIVIILNPLIKFKKLNIFRVIIFCLSFFIVSGWWYYLHITFTRWIVGIPFLPKPIPYLVYLEKFFYFQQPKKLFNYFWGTFGWVDTRLPRIVYYVLFIFSGSCFLGFLGYLRSLKKSFKKYLWLWESLFLISLFSFFLSYYEWHYYQIHQDFFLQGRYFFPMIVPIIIFLTLGWQNLFPKKWQNKALFGLTFLMITFNFYCLFFIMIPRYYTARDVVGLVIQLSQYKPEFLKGVAWPILLGIYLTLIGVLIKNLHQLLWKAKEK